MAVTERDVIYSYLGGLGRGPTRSEVDTAISNPAITDDDTLLAAIKATDEGLVKIPDTNLTVVANVYMNLFNLQYAQVKTYVDYYTSKIVDSTYTANEIVLQIVRDSKNLTYGTSEELQLIFNSTKYLIRKYNLAYVEITPGFSVDEEGNIIEVAALESTDISMADITNPTIVNGADGLEVQGDGNFEVLMKSFNAHLTVQYKLGRIKGPEYAQAYTTLLAKALDTSVQFVMNEKTTDENIKLIRANTELTRRKTI